MRITFIFVYIYFFSMISGPLKSSTSPSHLVRIFCLARLGTLKRNISPLTNSLPQKLQQDIKIIIIIIKVIYFKPGKFVSLIGTAAPLD
jgi:hypothetical protein